jgi:hypothetical protein
MECRRALEVLVDVVPHPIAERDNHAHAGKVQQTIVDEDQFEEH